MYQNMDFYPVYIYGLLVIFVTLSILALSGLFPSQKTSATKFLPYESGIKTEAHLQQERFPLRHYLVALMFLVLDIEVIFLYPWAVISTSLGPFAFYEMMLFLVILLVGFIYIWRKGGLQWE